MCCLASTPAAFFPPSPTLPSTLHLNLIHDDQKTLSSSSPDTCIRCESLRRLPSVLHSANNDKAPELAHRQVPAWEEGASVRREVSNQLRKSDEACRKL
jgi:hypothetical protein